MLNSIRQYVLALVEGVIPSALQRARKAASASVFSEALPKNFEIAGVVIVPFLYGKAWCFSAVQLS